MARSGGTQGTRFILLAMCLLFGIQEVAMRGSLRYQQAFETPAQGRAQFNLQASADTHTVELETSDAIALRWALSDPSGAEISSGYEAEAKRGTRRIVFAPRVGGSYRLDFGKQRQNHPAPGGAEVRVRSGDRRISQRILDLVEQYVS